MTTHLTPSEVGHLVSLVCSIRPEWPAFYLQGVLDGHRDQLGATDLAVATLRAAANPDLRTPKAIMWRGRHWDHATTTPAEITAGPRCDVCGKREDRCYLERPGPDEHPFTPPTLDRPGVPGRR